jgi:hypothetical protein
VAKRKGRQKMFSTDLYTKIMLTIITACLVVLCLKQSRWSHVDAVQAQTEGLLIKGYIVNSGGHTRTILFGPEGQAGVPVIVMNK